MTQLKHGKGMEIWILTLHFREITGINYIAGMGDDKELLVGVLNTNSLEDTEVEKEFEKQDGKVLKEIPKK